VTSADTGIFSQVTRTVLVSVMASATILAVVYLIAYRNPRDFRLGYACAIMFLGLAATGATEQAREMLRKPYVIGEHMYSNGIRKTPVQTAQGQMSEVEKFNRVGYLTDTIWATPGEHVAWALADQQQVPRAMFASTAAGMDVSSNLGRAHFVAGKADPFGDTGPAARTEGEPVIPSPARETLARGQLMFRGQCLACHTVDGYRSMREFLKGRDRESIKNVLTMLHEYKEDSHYRAFMPPLVGTSGEIDALAIYLERLVNPPDAELSSNATDAPTP
jgi:mono/diheme cytochrome c family protein